MAEYLGSVSDVLELAVPVILALDHASSVELTTLELHSHHVPCRFMEKLYWYSQTPAHGFVFFTTLPSSSFVLCPQKP